MAAKKGNNYAEDEGRPTKYDQSYDERAFKYCLLGLTDAQIAPLFGVVEKTINNWKIEHPSFLQSMNKGKDDADAEVAASLYNRAIGYKEKDVKIFQFQGGKVVVPYTRIVDPDVTAQRLWLSNRQRKNWKGDSVDVTSKGESIAPANPLSVLSTDLLEQIEAQLKEKEENE